MKTNKGLFFTLLIFFSLICLFNTSESRAQNYRLGVPRGFSTPTYAKLFKELANKGLKEGDNLSIVRIDLSNYQTDSEKEKIRRNIRERCDVFFSTGDHLPIIIDAQIQTPLVFVKLFGTQPELPKSMSANSTGFYRGMVDNIFAQTLQLLPDGQRNKLGLIYFKGSGIEAVIDAYPVISRKLGFKLIFKNYDQAGDIEAVMREFKKEGADAVALFPPAVRKEDLPELIKWQLDLKLPVIGQEKIVIEHGVLGGPTIDFDSLTPKIAEYIIKVLKGRSPGKLPIQYFSSRYVVNLATASKLGIQIPEDVISQSVIVGTASKPDEVKSVPISIVPGDYKLGVPNNVPVQSLTNLLKALKERGYVEGINMKIIRVDLKGSNDPAERRKIIKRIHDEVDVFYTSGNVLPTLIQLKDLQTPVCFVSTLETANVLPDSLKNTFTGVIRASFASIVNKSKNLMNGAGRMGLLARSNSNLHRLLNKYKATASAYNVEIEYRFFDRTEEIEAAMIEMKPKIDFIMLFPPAITNKDLDEVIRLQNKLHIPVLGQTIEHIKRGLLGGPAIDFDKLTPKAAEYIDKMFQGRSPSKLPVYYYSEKYVINLRVASKMNIEIPANVAAQALIIN